MIKIFKIIEKIVWALVAIAVIMILALIAISVANNADNISDRLDKIINDIAAVPNTDNSSIVDFLKSNLPNIVSTLVDHQVRQQVAYEKKS